MRSLRGICKRVDFLKALAVAGVVDVREWRDLDEGLVLRTPISWDPWARGLVRLEAVVDARPGEGLEPYLWVDSNVGGLLHLDGTPYHGVDPYHVEVRVPPGRHLVLLELSNRGLLGEVPETCTLRGVRLILVDPVVRRLAHRLDALVDLASTLLDLGSRDAAYDLLRLVDDALKVVRPTRLGPEHVVYLVEHVWRGKSHTLLSLYNELYWMARRSPERLVEAGFRGPDRGELRARCLEASRLLDEELRRLRGRYGKRGRVVAVGHAHIDTAWLWPYSETVRKLAATTANVLRLHEAEEGFVYAQGTALYYEWLKEYYPALYEEVRKAIGEGWWEPVASLWVECDCNLVWGESLVRQLLYGQRLLLRELGRTSRVAWLPDTFGFPASMPQLLRKAGVEMFFTHKLAWNRVNRFPYTTFYWEGVDGTRVLAHMIRVGYGVVVSARSVLRAWEEYDEKDLVPVTLLAYGYSDGGGGPSWEMVERLKALNEAPLAPEVRFGGPERYLDEVKRDSRSSRLPLWRGELYLEAHRGTYTTNTRVKQLVREAERWLRCAELLSALASLHGHEYPKRALGGLWRRLLRNQFHDVLPGTSKAEVYEEVYRELEEVAEEARRLAYEALERIALEAEGRGLLVFNPTQWPRREVVELELPRGVAVRGVDAVQVVEEGEDAWRVLVPVEVPGLGYRVLELCEAEGAEGAGEGVVVEEVEDGFLVENEYYRILIGLDGALKSMYDKELGRELLRAPSNVIVAYEDLPTLWDAWDVEEDYAECSWPICDVVETRVVERGPLRARIRVVKRYEGSTVTMDVVVYRGSRRIDFELLADWREKDVLVKTWFHLDMSEPRAFFMVPYGVVERPTRARSSWDRARYEVPLTGWLDLSCGDWGFTVISDTPRGVSVQGSSVGLTILKSPIQPNPLTDSGIIKLRYSVLAHRGPGYMDAVAEYYRVAYPLLHVVKEAGMGRLPGVCSLVSVEPGSVVLEVVKEAEDGDGLVLRLYEVAGSPAEARVKLWGLGEHRYLETDLVELERLGPLATGREVRVALRPLEVKTVKLLVGC